MKFSHRLKNKILQNLLSSEINSNTFAINDVKNFQNSLYHLSNEELVKYLKILEWEHLIDVEYDTDNNISVIYVLPNAFEQFSLYKSETLYRNITMFFAVLTTICTIIQVTDLFLRVQV